MKEPAGFESNGLALIDMKDKLLPFESTLDDYKKLIGAEKDLFQRIEARWGFDGKALATDVRLIAPAPRQGLAALFDQPTFSLKDLPPIPADQNSFTVVSLQADEVFDRLAKLPVLVDPLKKFADATFEQTGLKLRDDLLTKLGPKVAFYIVPKKKKDDDDGDALDFRMRNAVVLIELRDRAAIADALPKLADRLNRSIAALDPSREPAGKVERLPAPETGLVLRARTDTFSMLTGKTPTILLGRRYLVVASFLEQARAAIALESKPDACWKPRGELVSIARTPRTVDVPQRRRFAQRQLAWIARELPLSDSVRLERRCLQRPGGKRSRGPFSTACSSSLRRA